MEAHSQVFKDKKSLTDEAFVLEAGLEPARANAHRILSPACLPIPPLEQVMRRASEGIRTLDPHLGKVMLYP